MEMPVCHTTHESSASVALLSKTDHYCLSYHIKIMNFLQFLKKEASTYYFTEIFDLVDLDP